MPNLVTAGATLRCSMGSATSALQVVDARTVNDGGKPVAIVSDAKALVNILPFGQCSSTANPRYSPRQRVLPPCTPVFPASWIPGSPSVKAGGLPLLNSGCQCPCQYGGVVTILTPGQQTTTVA